MESIEPQRQVPVAELSRTLLVTYSNSLELLEEQREVTHVNVTSQLTGSLGALKQALGEVVCRAAGTVQLLVGAERAGEAHRKSTGARIEPSAHKLTEGEPRITLVGERGLSSGNVALQSHETQMLE